jgi:streptomycin 6-kinase
VTYAERADGTPCILKLSPPFEEAVGEAEALSLYAGDGSCRLLERDDAVSALLLGRITPGLPLQKVWTPEVDETHTRITAELMQRLWRRVAEPHPFRSLQSWARALSEDPGPGVPTPFRERAQALLADLSPDSDPVLLHADLHHGNILSASNEPYLAIDPKGVVGARGYDVGTYLLNPVRANADELSALLPRRLAIFSELLGLSERELAAWGFVHAVLSACWDADLPGSWDVRALEVAEALAPLS